MPTLKDSENIGYLLKKWHASTTFTFLIANSGIANYGHVWDCSTPPNSAPWSGRSPKHPNSTTLWRSHSQLHESGDQIHGFGGYPQRVLQKSIFQYPHGVGGKLPTNTLHPIFFGNVSFPIVGPCPSHTQLAASSSNVTLDTTTSEATKWICVQARSIPRLAP